MRDWSLGARLAIALFVCQIASPTVAAPANDVVVMPYRCSMSAGKPVLTPVDDDLGHRILGAREQKKIKTCSTTDAKRCRQWTAFKFDIDCDGTRVSWMHVFANASEHTRRRVWEHNGRLRVRDTKVRNPRIDDMCARRLGPHMEWSSTSELCDEVSTATAPTATDMPAGFAPMIGLDAVILPGDAFSKRGGRTVASTAGETTEQAARTTGAQPTAQKTATPAPVTTSRTKTAADQATLTPPVVNPPPSAAEEPAAAAALPEKEAAPERVALASEARPSSVAMVDAPPPQTETTSSVEPPATTLARSPDEAAAPQILNATPAQDATPVPTVAERAPAAPATEPRVEEPASDVRTAAQGESQIVVPVVIEPSAGAGQDETGHTPYLILALASGLSMIALLSVYWFGNARTANTPLGDATSAPKLEPAFAEALQMPAGPKPAVAAPVADATTSAPPGRELIVLPIARRSHSSVQAPSGSVVPGRLSIGDRLPSTKNEALELLGMGIATDGNLTSLKKIIDGLRMNWHPDHAADEADRRTRELRLKQINAAWEILGGKTAGA